MVVGANNQTKVGQSPLFCAADEGHTDATGSTSIWLTVTFTIERYIAVCHPIKGKVYCTESRAMIVIGVVYAVCFTLTASTPHEWVIEEVRNNATGTSVLRLDYSDLGRNDTYKMVFYWFTAVCFILLPLVLLSVFNSFLIYVVKQSRAQRRTMTSQRLERDSHSQSQENKITVMLIAVVLLALVCQLPVAVLLLYKSFNEVGFFGGLGGWGGVWGGGWRGWGGGRGLGFGWW
ncbi:FMRFamide receptor [Penaeus vannamei]|uniref:FMRFamide receptor n=1 Tax=Penaeus vannamei TaxID=6689 RepID=A0A423TPK7_PENVA|nr:FMRFamide receptor [Penaeus vannamei]